jgi:hypothetical protein
MICFRYQLPLLIPPNLPLKRSSLELEMDCPPVVKDFADRMYVPFLSLFTPFGGDRRFDTGSRVAIGRSHLKRQANPVHFVLQVSRILPALLWVCGFSVIN